jgi:dipeptidyl aminopeptidase/acylaminoacyl peptidase
MKRHLAAALACAATIALAADPKVEVEPYFKHADYGDFELSPSGKYVAGLVPVNGRMGLVTVDLATRKPGEPTIVRASDVGWFTWVNDNRLVFMVLDRQVGAGVQRGSGLFAVNRDGSDFHMLVRPPTIAGQFVYRYTRFLATLPGNSDDILVVANDTNERYPDVYRLNTSNGRKTLLSLDKPGDVVRWLADRKGAVRVAVTDEKGGGRWYWRASESARWEMMQEWQAHAPHHVPIAFDGDGSLIVASRPDGRDTYALYRFDPAKKALGELMAAHPQVDLTELVYDRKKERVVGVRYEADQPGVAWFDEDWARLAASVDRALPGRFNEISRGDGPNVLVYSYSDKDPGAYYLLDSDKRKLERLVAVRAGIDPAQMPARKLVRYPARDGLTIPAWLTLPPGREAKNLPLVMYVHGGPWMRGATWAWQDVPAFLANQGYAVLEPEFRGSLGWGDKLYRASFKEWGRAMQDDLDDGMDWLAKQGTIDPARACIAGASYGGYAVMMGLVRNPERWRCGVNYVGVTDIALVFDVTWSDTADSTFIKFLAKDMIGDPVADAEKLKAVSPLAQADRIKAPVLMAYGSDDRRVPLVHGTQMKDKLVARGVPVEWVVYGEEGHYFLLDESRFDFFRRVAAFLARHLK